MGDAALPQHTAGGFVPMLGVGMVGSVPGAVTGPISGTRSSAVPQLHNAIVERLRARIELCRRHHSNCESRHQRGQAENSDREHETTLHLLDIVHQGPGNRKSKGKNSAQQPPEYNNRVNGEQKSQNTSIPEPKNSTRLALQGSLRRKIERQPPAFGPDFKRMRVEGDAAGHGDCVFRNGQSQPLSGGTSVERSLQRDNNNMMTHSVGKDPYCIALKEVKKEPGEIHSCGQSSLDPAMMVFDFKEEGDDQIDPELQDLFDELTKSVPSLNDLEFEKMLKQDDTFGLDLGHSSLAAGSPPCSLVDRVIKAEYSPGFSQSALGLPQLRAASTGPVFSVASTLPSSFVSAALQIPSQGLQVSSGASRSMTTWTEVSHAEQLKQMAANQQTSALLHHHQKNQSGAAVSWSAAMSTHSSLGSFRPENISSSAPLCQQTISPQSSIQPPMSSNQSKGMNNCLFTSQTNSTSNLMDMKVLSSKPLSHFNSKSHVTIGQQTSLITSPQSKPSLHYQQQKPQPQQSTAGHNQPHPSPHFQSPPPPRLPGIPAPPCLKTKSQPLNQHAPGLHLKLAQQRQTQQVLPSGACLSSSSNFVNISGLSLLQQQPSAFNNQQKIMGKNQAMKRQLGLQQQTINDSEKLSQQDQLNRHLTRPPPDYKQPRINMVGGQQANQYTGGLSLGINSSQSLTNTVTSPVQTNSHHLSSGQSTNMNSSPSDRRFGNGTEPLQRGYNVQNVASQLQQPGTQNQIGLNQNGPRFPGPNNLGKTFGSRLEINQEAPVMPRQPLESTMTNGNMVASTNWAEGSKQTTVLPSPLNLRRFPTALQTHQGGQTDTSNLQFPQRAIPLPNQGAAGNPLLSTNKAINRQTLVVRGSTSRTSLPRMNPVPTVTNVSQVPPLQSLPTVTFTNAAQNHHSYQSNHGGSLTFDFLQDGDNTVPGINSDSDFIDSLLKSGSGNDDWMKDINLDEILGNHA